MADDEGSNEEGGKGDDSSDEGGGQATATMVKKRARAARAMVTRIVGNEEGDGDGGNMARNNDDGLVPVAVHQPILYTAFASLDNVGNNKSNGRGLSYALRMDDVGDNQTTMTMTTTTLSCCPLMCNALSSSCLSRCL